MKSTAFAFLFFALVAASAAQAVPRYKVVPLGLDDFEHTDLFGNKNNTAIQLNETGQVTGHSVRYNGGSPNLGQSAWLYDGSTTVHIGLTGAEHTDIDGRKSSSAQQLNGAGQVVGGSVVFNGGNRRLGRSAWLYDGATTIDIGLSGAQYTSSGGYKTSEAHELNEAGQVSGQSDRYNGGDAILGRTAWLYDGATTIDIGLAGIEHTRSNGDRFSTVGDLNEAGQVIGNSSRFNGGNNNDLGASAWLYDGATTIDIGLIGAEHTSSGGYKSSVANQLNEAGQVIGRSDRYNGGNISLGFSAWLYDGATTIDIGLTDASHTSNDGEKHDSQALQLNEAGQVRGYSARYDGGSIHLGYSAWLYDGTTTFVIGLTGAEHTSSDGYRNSSTDELNEAGQVIGYSNRYNGNNTELGRSAWLYDGTSTIGVGLTGAEHTSNDGKKYSVAEELNGAGRVIGHSERYNGGSTEWGRSAWLYDGTTTIDIGLTGADYISSDGKQYSVAEQLNEAGQVIGRSVRYDGGSTDLGLDAWLYDPALNQTFPLQFSTPSDVYAESFVHYLGEDGLALGSYTLFDGLENSLGQRAFYFTIADGLHDLGTLVDGGLTADGWDHLADGIRANGGGKIIGHGKLTSQPGGYMAYLLTPVPEPSAATLMILAAAGWFLRRRG